MAKLRMPTAIAAALSVRERVLLFCAASGTDWQHAGIAGEIVTAMVVKGAKAGIATTVEPLWPHFDFLASRKGCFLPAIFPRYRLCAATPANRALSLPPVTSPKSNSFPSTTRVHFHLLASAELTGSTLTS